MRINRSLLLSLLISLIILTSGCIYTRLLQVKRQLSHFNTYFRIEEQDKLTLLFRAPVLTASDITWLLKSPPMSRSETGQGELWAYVFEKQYADLKDEEGEFDIPVYMTFQDGKLSQISFPERFLKYFSKDQLIKMFTSVGEAEIDKSERRAGSSYQAEDSLEIPRKEQVLELLGTPYSTVESDETVNFIYNYDLENREPESNSDEYILVLTFKFEREGDKLLKEETNLRGLRMSLDFSLDQEHP